MKRILIWLMILSLIPCAVALADDTGIQMIGVIGTQEEEAVVDLSDFKVGETAVIDGFGEVTFTEAGWSNILSKYDSYTFYDTHGREWYACEYYESGDEAKYLRLLFDILNTQKEPVTFYDKFSDVICTYDDEYLFGGWIRQHTKISDEGHDLITLSDTASGTPIETFYRGQYSVVITLPNDVYERVTDKKDPKPLTVTFMLGENEVTYIYRGE